MKNFGAIAVVLAFIACTTGVFVPPRPGSRRPHLLGEKECTWGPSYWCQNLTTAGDCHATKHCIQTQWIYKEVEPDHNSICDTCIDMVTQARDQLESNETQELIKEVFEGSCDLLRIKTIVKECDKLADEYIPDLIDTLASQMNPQVVCSVAGLCNSPRVHQLLKEYTEQQSQAVEPVTKDTCTNCHTVMDIVIPKFLSMNQGQVLDAFLLTCSKMGSFTDACAANLIENFDELYFYLKENLNTKDICLISGECFAQFHQHEPNLEITPMSSVGYVPVNGRQTDDMPCDLCKQLVQHVRDMLTANTTESEFKLVLEGLCKQTGKFAQQCESYVEQYYAEIYDFLVNDVDPTGVCTLIGVCNPATQEKLTYFAPLLPAETAPKAVKLLASIKEQDKQIETIDPLTFQLPIERVMPPMADVYNTQVCVFCEYLLHYIQTAITDPKSEEKIREALDKACEKLPNSINSTCINFLNTYEPAFVALLAQEIDPAQICPLVKACPSEAHATDIDLFMSNPRSSEKCPLCLYAVTELESMIKDKTNKDEIKQAIEKMCTHLAKSLQAECTQFVDQYTDQLIEMLVADFKPQEVCVYLKLCNDTTPVKEEKLQTEIAFEEKKSYGGDIETNIIPDYTINGKLVADSKCVLCEFIMREIDNQLKNKKTDEDIKTVVRDICKVMPSTIKSQCNNYIDQYGDMVIILLEEALEPEKICTVMKMCTKLDHIGVVKVEILDCAICEATVKAMEKILSNPNVDHNIEHVFEKTCRALPFNYRKRCVTLVEDYGKLIIDFVGHSSAKQVCRRIYLCNADSYGFVGLL